MRRVTSRAASRWTIMNLTKFTPYPGSPIYRGSLRHEDPRPEDWAQDERHDLRVVARGLFDRTARPRLPAPAAVRSTSAHASVHHYVLLTLRHPTHCAACCCASALGYAGAKLRSRSSGQRGLLVQKAESLSLATPASMRYDVIVVGGGAAGLMCAIEAGKRGRSRRCVIERNERVGQEDPHLRRRALQLHQPQHRAGATSSPPTRTSAARRSPATRRRTSSRWSRRTASPTTRRSSASSSAMAAPRQIVDMLLAECAAAGVEVRLRLSRRGGARGRRLRASRTDRGDVRRASRWWWRPAGSRSRRWARRISATGWRGSSGSASSSRGRGSCR